MSRAYRIRVKESLRRVLRAHDRVSTQLEILEVLPADQMAELLASELEKRGFERDGNELTREEEGVRVTVDVTTGTVTVSAETEESVELQRERTGSSYTPDDQTVERQLRETAQREMEAEAEAQTETLQSEVTDRLEKQLGNLRRELDQAVNRVTAEALKQKAGKLGQIKEMTEDEETGSLTIVVEV